MRGGQKRLIATSSLPVTSEGAPVRFAPHNTLDELHHLGDRAACERPGGQLELVEQLPSPDRPLIGF
jgi:hypothetical protein